MANPRVGIVGLGFGAQVHLPAFQSEGWEVAVVCSRHADKARAAADAAGVADVCTDPMQLVARDDISAIAISTPPRTHHPIAMAALAAGKHVLCEKPFAMNATEAAEMRDAAARYGRTAMVAHEFRYTPQRAYIGQLLRDGYIGRFTMCTLELFLDRYATAQPRAFSWQALKAEGGGLLGALGSHYIDGLRDWFGEVVSVSCQLAALRPEVLDAATGKIVTAESDDTFSFTLNFAGGGMALMIASFAATPTRGARIAVMGDEGTLMAEQAGPNPTDDGVVVGSRKGSPLAPLPTPARFRLDKDARDHRLMAFRMLVRDFTEGIANARSPNPNFEDGWRCQQVLDAARLSSDTGALVKVA
ncbi:MAG TPA: Gfo/Idh/MocA family oxidoreductase [Casimicrobiaceae bacterium]|nr:Gfo/Idh/MocA family oxidoreductase [Casimicrobiaceae bacterium]